MTKIPVKLVVAIDSENGIGKDGQLPWHLPEDLKYFKELTTKASSGKQNAVVMGRKTWESIPEKFRPLPDRLNIVLTRQEKLSNQEGIEVLNSFDELISWLDDSVSKEQIDQCFIIGGQTIFEEAMKQNLIDEMYITHIFHTFTCDTFFPTLPSHFECIQQSEKHQNDHFSYQFSVYKQKS